MSRTYSLVVASNDDATLERNLLASELVVKRQADLHIDKNAPSAAQAYNRALATTEADIVIFAHQDVYFPPGWIEKLENAIAQVEQDDPDWAVIGAIGMSHDARLVGEVWSTSQGTIIGTALSAPVPVQSMDEMLLVVRRASGIRFDSDLPGFHMYGTDVVQTAIAAGKGAYVCHLPTVHNDKFHGCLRRDFALAYRFVRLKWRQQLPIRTTVLWVTGSGLALPYYRLTAWKSLEKRRALSGDTQKHSREFSILCGWE